MMLHRLGLLLFLRISTIGWCQFTNDLSTTRHMLFATSAREALVALVRALPYVSEICAASKWPASRVACAEREFIQRALAWTEWQIKFRSKDLDNKITDIRCFKFCDAVSNKMVRFVMQGHKRFRKGYGNHAMGTLNALAYAILTNRSAVLGLDHETRELNMPHLLYDDTVIWTVADLRNRYLRCGCHPLPRMIKPNMPLWHAQKQISHLDGMSPNDRWPLAAEPGSPIGLGLEDTLKRTNFFFSQETHHRRPIPGDKKIENCHPIGNHFLYRGFIELNTMPNIYGILFYAFFRPSPTLALFLSNRTQGFDLGIHIRVNMHLGTTTHGASVIHAKEKKWRLNPLQEAWSHHLVSSQLPRLLRGGFRPLALPMSTTVLLVSDQPSVSKGLAPRLLSHHDSSNGHRIRVTALDVNSSATEEVTAITYAENDGRFMIRSADWGQSPRWVSLAELYVLSNARIAIACAGPYSPSTFCEIAAALAATRRALLPRYGNTKHLLPTWRLHAPRSKAKSHLILPGSLFWCPSDGPNNDPDLPPCCETAFLSGGGGREKG